MHKMLTEKATYVGIGRYITIKMIVQQQQLQVLKKSVQWVF